MPRLPSSLKWLIDRRARVAGEIEKIEALLANCNRIADEIRSLKELLASIDQTLALHDVKVDSTLISSVKSHDVRIPLPHGALTKAILLCLRLNEDAPVSTNAITAFIAAKYEDLEARSMYGLQQSVRYRLKNLCRQGIVMRHHSKTTNGIGLWTINKPMANGNS